MIWQTKKFLISLSIVLGVLIILGAANTAGVFTFSSSSKNESDSGWEAALSILPGSETLTRAIKGDVSIDKGNTLATTTTDIIARRLIIEYALSQKNSATSTMSDAEATKIANILAGEVKLPQKKQYTLSDLNISKDNSEKAGALYKNSVNALIQKHTLSEQIESELSIVLVALNTKNAASLDKLDAKVALYQDLIKNLLALKTPSTVASIHLHLVQSYETLRVATIGLQSMLPDPIIGVASLTEYRSGVDSLLRTEKEYYDFGLSNQ